MDRILSLLSPLLIGVQTVVSLVFLTVTEVLQHLFICISVFIVLLSRKEHFMQAVKGHMIQKSVDVAFRGRSHG